MTTAANDTAAEAAFEAFLAGRPAPEEAADSFHAVAAFAGAVRATATLPGRPNAALAELLATGLLTDQSSPSARTATSAGKSPRRSRIRRRRFAVFFPALIAKFLSAGAMAQAATGATVAVVAFTGVGAMGALPDPVQDTFATVVATVTPLEAPTGEEATEGVVSEELVVEDVETTDETTEADPVDVVQAWIDEGPEGYDSFGEWVSESARDPLLREGLRASGQNFGSVISMWAHNKGYTEDELADEGVDLDELTDDASTEPVTGETETEADDATEDAKVGSTERGNGNGHGNAGGNGRGHN
jgi:hypothetical protein